ncbi:hypothetical protein [Brevundimonas denitrificans]|uniref:hypothetical protein n=1 Tax=Brevundimonas denitrificans TaxID=1443434 RepID=UPI00223AA873|nr:hypothetical protein [Brevundimonas denitrificans]
MTTRPAASMTRAPAGTAASGPMALMRPLRITTVPEAISPVPVRMRPLVMATAS